MHSNQVFVGKKGFKLFVARKEWGSENKN